MPVLSKGQGEGEWGLSRAVGFVSGVLFGGGTGKGKGKGKGKEKEKKKEKGKGREGERDGEMDWSHFGKELPRAWDIVEGPVGTGIEPDVLRGCKRVVVIGIHGWFPGTFPRIHFPFFFSSLFDTIESL